MRKAITKRSVDALKPGEIIADDAVMGFVARRLPSGLLTYGYRYRKDGKRRWIGLGVGLTPDAARKAAQILAGEVAQRQDPLPEREARRIESLAARTLDQVLDDWLAKHVRAKQLRSYDEVASLLQRYVRPRLGGRRVNELKRVEIVDLLDVIADQPSKYSRDGKSRRVADKVLGVLRSALNWHATRDSEFVSPIVNRMARTSLKELSRDRILADDEIRSLWAALDSATPEPYPRLVRALLLSGARLNEVARLQWIEIISGDVAIIPASRTKTKIDHAVPLTPAMVELLGGRGEAGDRVFSTDHGHTAFSGFSKAKARLDKALAEQRKRDGLPPMAGWRLHDLRRTARSLMSRAGVNVDIAERVLGHALPGIRGVYDRHEYLTEKRDALERLDALVRSIIDPPPANVVTLSAGKRRAH
ncbi:MAG: tyrosine-type recombinase/integrase [Reyranellaceae bacterium]